MAKLKWSSAPADPTLEGWQANTYGQNQGIGKAGKYYKQLLNRIGSGEDTSSFGEFNPIAQQHAVNRREIDDSMGYGGNALIASTGGEQANILTRMKQQALDRDFERQGMETGDALSRLRTEAAGGFQSAYDSARGRELQQQGLALNNRLGYYGQKNQSYLAKSAWDKLMDVGNLVVGGAKAAAGLGYRPGGR